MIIKKKTIILAAGGTGGHFFPAIALAEEMEKYGHDIHLFTDERCAKYLTNNMPVKPRISKLHIRMSGPFFGLFNKIKSIMQLFSECLRNLILLKKIQPAIVIGFGGYPSFPTIFAATILRIPIILQEQNCFLGKSNRIFARYAKHIAVSYPEISNISARDKNKVIVTGDLIRKTIGSLPKKSSFDSEIFRLFIVGGSQGASIFSQIVPKTIDIIRQKHPELNLEIIQQAPDKDRDLLVQNYEKIGIKYNIQSFFHDIHDIYAKSDLVIARSGATTIAELSAIRLPAIFVPYPYAAENHQKFNAMALVKDKASWCIDQNELSTKILSQQLLDLIKNRSKIYEASKNLSKRKNDGAKHLSDTVLKIIS